MRALHTNIPQGGSRPPSLPGESGRGRAWTGQREAPSSPPAPATGTELNRAGRSGAKWGHSRGRGGQGPGLPGPPCPPGRGLGGPRAGRSGVWSGVAAPRREPRPSRRAESRGAEASPVQPWRRRTRDRLDSTRAEPAKRALRGPRTRGQRARPKWAAGRTDFPRTSGRLLGVAALLALAAREAAPSLSGLYVDNGVDQTLMQRSLTRHEREEVEHEILNLLGLPERPRGPKSPQRAQGAQAARVRSRSGGGRSRRTRLHHHLGASAPQFLLDVYQSLEETGSLLDMHGDFNLTGNDQTAITQSDVIMTFASHNKHVSALRHERGKRLWFDVSEVLAGEGIMGAELRLYQRPVRHDVPIVGDGTYTINVYLVVSVEHGEKELEFVDSVNTTHSNQGWHVFNMTGALSNWVAFPSSNLGLYLSLRSNVRPGHDLRPENIGLVSGGGEEEKQPFMVAFLKSSPGGAKVRTTRDAGRRRIKKAEVSVSEPLPRNPFDPKASLWSARTCQIKNLYVSFKDLDWQDWIIAPDGYAAFYCSGECNFPLNSNMNATNHAIVQTLVHLFKPGLVPKPCCVPTKLTPISVLYFLDDSNVVLKKYKNMVVKSCGCH